jgi:biopolymer transport protein ExbD
VSVSLNYLGKGSFENHLSLRQSKNKKIKKMLVMGLSLTSMVDVFSMLVCFLLQTFSSSPEILITKDVNLPEALKGQEIKQAPVLSLSQKSIYLDQKEVGNIKDVVTKPAMLIEKLKEFKVHFAKTNPGEPFPGEINLQADEGIPSVIVSQLMSHLNSQNFHSIHLAVISGGK